MLDEFKTTEYIINELSNQEGFFKENINNVETLLKCVSKLKMKYEIPYLLYLTRQSENYYNKQVSVISEDITYELNLYFKEKIGQEYSVRFLDIKRMVFTLHKEDIEIVRFSLVNRNYSFMNSIIQDEEEYVKSKSSIEKSIESIKEDILTNLIRLNLYEKIQSSNWELIKKIKGFKDVYSLLFRFNNTKKGIANRIVHLEGKHESLARSEETERERLQHLNEKHERSKPIVEVVQELFNEIEYAQDERHLFYM